MYWEFLFTELDRWTKNTAAHERKNVSEKFVVSEFVCIFVYQNKTKQQ